MIIMKEKKEYDLTVVYDFKEHPDIISGRCHNFNNVQLPLFINFLDENNLIY